MKTTASESLFHKGIIKRNCEQMQEPTVNHQAELGEGRIVEARSRTAGDQAHQKNMVYRTHKGSLRLKQQSQNL